MPSAEVGELVVDQDAAAGLQASGLGQRHRWPHTDRHHEKVAGDVAPVVELDCPHAVLAEDPARGCAEQDANTFCLQRTLEKAGGRGIELPLHQPVHQMDQRYTRSGADQAVGRLDTEQSAADHDGASLSLLLPT